MIHVAVGILLDNKKRVLIARRPAHKYCPGLWEFPGGKVETGEEVYAALKREFQEEIGIQIISATPWFKIQHSYPDRVVMLDNWVVTKFLGEPQGAEGQEIRWAACSELLDFEFPEGNLEIIKRLQSGLVI